MNKILNTLSALSLISATSALSGQLVVTQNNDADALASALIGSGISLVGGSASFTGNSIGAGTFTGGSSLIGINDGIILSTGDVLDAPGPNSSTAITSFNTSSELEFQITTITGDLFFNFVFASDEYTEWSDSTYNDEFLLEVNGVNRALIPGTTVPVTVNNINESADDYPEFFNDNTAGSVNIEYDGFTDVFTAQALGLGAGTHTVRFFISDVGDEEYDSAVFIQGGSFTSVNPVPEPSTVAGLAVLTMLGLLGFRSRRKRRAA